jgi:hypothetical protein
MEPALGIEPRTCTCSVLMDQPRSVTATFTVRMIPISLTVLGVAGHAGTLAAEDGSITCSGRCPDLSHAATTSFTLIATAAPGGSTFAAWTSGPCRGTDPTCTFPLTSAVAISATFGPQAYMFVTSSTVVPGMLGGIEGGDTECQRLADNAGLPGTYMAWLSTGTSPSDVNARDRVGEGGWIRTDGRPFTRLLGDLADPASLTVYYPPRVDEAGNDLGNVSTLVATGGDKGGRALGDQCNGYTRTTGNLYVGDASSGSGAWNQTQLVPGGCASPFHLYCFRSDMNAGAITPPAEAGRRVFVTTRPFVIGGPANPNVFCQEEANDGGLPNPQGYVAFLATGTTPAMNLIASTGPWKRLDDVIVADQATDFATGGLLAPFSLAPDGSYRPDRVWTGAANPTVPGTATCNDWMGATAAALAGDGRTSAAPAWFSLGDTIPCSGSITHLMCLEP